MRSKRPRHQYLIQPERLLKRPQGFIIVSCVVGTTALCPLAFARLGFNHTLIPIAIAPNYPISRLDEGSHRLLRRKTTEPAVTVGKKVGKKLMNQPWLTIVGIAVGSLVVNASQSLALSVMPGSDRLDNNLYAYHQPEELLETLRKQEQKIVCQATDISSLARPFPDLGQSRSCPPAT